MKNFIFLLSSLLCLQCVVPIAVARSPNGDASVQVHLYKYKDGDGNVYVSRQIPPENYKYGYTGLNELGEVILEVPPEPTEEDRRNYTLKIERKLEAERRAKDDEMLLKTHSSSKDALRARDQKMKQIDVMIEIIRAQISSKQLDYDMLVERAAAIEKKGDEPEAGVVEELAAIEAEIAEMDLSIEAKEQEKRQVREEYVPIVKRLKQVESRNSKSKRKKPTAEKPS